MTEAERKAHAAGQRMMREAAVDAARTAAVLAGEERGERAAGRVEGAFAVERAIRALPIREVESR